MGPQAVGLYFIHFVIYREVLILPIVGLRMFF